MRICVVSSGDLGRDAETRLLVRSLASVGHEVTTVDGGRGVPDWPARAVRVAKSSGADAPVVRRLFERLESAGARQRRYRHALVEAVRRSDPEVIYPAAARDLELAIEAADGGAVVMRSPNWPAAAAVDMATLAPGRVDLSRSPAGPGLGHHEPGWSAGPPPEPLRHRGVKVVMVHRITATSPARYLTAALERAGVQVIAPGPELDWDAVPDDAAAVVIVESLLPEVRITGSRKDVPVLFWVHHGEHHLMQNLRLSRRYEADAVLLAHSWHLAHRFAVPVHRFPFGVPIELVPAAVAFDRRDLAVAMVGSGLDDASGRYRRRSARARELHERFGERAAMISGLAPEDLMRRYGRARVVVNDGGDRHLPITMRVFEATGAGAVLLTDSLPGTELLFEPHTEYAVIEDDIADQVQTLQETGGPIAGAGHARAMRSHTYDHRVDELLEIAGQTAVRTPPAASRWERVLDVDVTTLAGAGVDDLIESLEDRALIGSHRHPDAALVGSAPDRQIEAAVQAARRFVYCVSPDERVRELVISLVPDGRSDEIDGVLRIEKDPGAGYRVQTEDSADG